MRGIDWRPWLWRYALPSLLLSIPGFLPLFVSVETRENASLDGVMLFGLFVAAPLAGFLIGVALRPTYVWISPLIAVGLFWVSAALNSSAREGWDAGDILLTVFLLGLPWMVMIWLGRALRDWLEDRFSRRQRGPGMPTS
jgi:hypothetical protein